eukprot:762727-Hanusia_phi.AAC.3
MSVSTKIFEILADLIDPKSRCDAKLRPAAMSVIHDGTRWNCDDCDDSNFLLPFDRFTCYWKCFDKLRQDSCRYLSLPRQSFCSPPSVPPGLSSHLIPSLVHTLLDPSVGSKNFLLGAGKWQDG